MEVFEAIIYATTIVVLVSIIIISTISVIKMYME